MQRSNTQKMKNLIKEISKSPSTLYNTFFRENKRKRKKILYTFTRWNIQEKHIYTQVFFNSPVPALLSAVIQDKKSWIKLETRGKSAFNFTSTLHGSLFKVAVISRTSRSLVLTFCRSLILKPTRSSYCDFGGMKPLGRCLLS